MITELVSVLGLPLDDQRLIDFLERNNINYADLAIPEGESDIHVERPKGGYCLLFTSEASFLCLIDKPVGYGKLYLTDVFLYSEGEDGYNQYMGRLPMNLSFGMTRTEINSLLGFPSWDRKRQDGSVVAERWDNLADYRIHITYARVIDRPTVIALGKPDMEPDS